MPQVTTKVLFVARDGTLIEAVPGHRVDSVAGVRLVPGVIPALRSLTQSGYGLVMASNQPGLGTTDYPQQRFDEVQGFLLELFQSQGVRFDQVFICAHLPSDNCSCRKPRAGLLKDYLATNDIDRTASAVVGAGASDMELAANIGLRGLTVRSSGGPEETWGHIAHELLQRPRRSQVRRNTAETDINVAVDLDRSGDIKISTGIGFFDHMLEQLAKHAGFSLKLTCEGDLHIDDHHTVEDVALALGEALAKALGDKRGIGRYGFLLPMDETQARVAIDLGGRPYAVFEAEWSRPDVGGMATELVPHFFHSLSQSLGAAIHVSVQGENTHHMVEAAFKGVARALRPALAREGNELPSTKGVL
jgi:imidazoleglycerol-phosphate dehydratase/histidinol-phosphatase